MDVSRHVFSWLHVSDFHCGMEGQDRVWPTVRRRVLDDLGRVHDECGPWDVIFFTGDLTQKGTPDEFARLAEELSHVLTRLKELGSEPILLTVPGNHDLVRPDPKRPEAKLLFSRWLRDYKLREEFWTDANGPYRTLVSEAFAPYSAWQSSHSLSRTVSVQSGLLPGDFAVEIVTGGTRIAVIGLNSAFLQLGSGPYLKRVAIDTRQMHGAIKGLGGFDWLDSVDLAFLMTHHPPGWLSAESHEDYLSNIYPPDRFVAHLFGHEHNHEQLNETFGADAPRRYWQAPSLFGLEYYGTRPRFERIHGYKAGRISIDSHGAWVCRQFPRQAARHQAGHWHIVPASSYSLTTDHGTVPEVLKPSAVTVLPEVRSHRTHPLSVAIIATTEDLEDARRNVAEHLRNALGVAVSELPSDDAGDQYDIAVIIQGWWWSGGIVAQLWRQIDAPCRLAFASDPESDWPSRRLSERGAELEVEEFRRTLHAHTFAHPSQVPELVSSRVTDYIHQLTGTEALGLSKWERTYLELRLQPWKAGRTAASRVHLLDAEELYQSELYTPLDGVSVRWTRGKDNRPQRIKNKRKKRKASTHISGTSEVRVPLSKWIGVEGLPRVAIVGAPGGGKTIFLTRLAAVLASACLGRLVELEPDLELQRLRSQPGLLPIPVVVEATRLAKSETINVHSLIDAICDEVGASGAERPSAEIVHRGLREGRYLLLIDALDEISDAGARISVVDVLKGLAAPTLFPRARVLVTTRSARYTGALSFGPQFEVVDVAPMSGTQVQQFCSNWSVHRMRDEDYRRSLLAAVDGLANDVRSAGEDQGLTENPLMLTAICMLFERYRSLPDDRGRLCDLLIDDLCRSRPSEDYDRGWKLDDTTKKDLLQRIAMGMQEEGAQSWPVTRAIEITLSTLPANDPHRQQRAKRYLDWTADHTGLLRFQQLESGEEQVRFWHRLFREYLCANRIAQIDSTASGKIENLWSQGRLLDPFWEDVLRLLPRALGTIEKAKSVYDTLATLANQHLEQQGRLTRIIRECGLKPPKGGFLLLSRSTDTTSCGKRRAVAVGAV